ncbi:chondroitinase family polysaccharide lyase [Carboxylicivirga sp. RSCT41]|uniref:chondroitinase family polysaccharide lyase n=1 Tax=Carboxylicivirga agarovorans TaxID=3417570 RepID=UPI003D35421F
MRLVLIILSIIASLSTVGQNYLGLEGSVPSDWSASDNGLSISGKHFKMGSESLMWDWSEGAQITITSPAGMADACKEYKGGMMLWIYNEDPKDADLTFQFKNAAAQVQYHFNYHINFSGWRACWIRFDEDMLGSKVDKNLTTMTIIAPVGKGGGKLFFDRMKFPSSRINDRVTPDAQLDFINPEMNANHWAALWHWHSSYVYEKVLPATMSDDENLAAADIRQRITNEVDGSAPSSSRITELQNEYNELNIQRNGGVITGAAFVVKDEALNSNNDKSFEDIELLLYDMAKAWHHNRQSGFDQMFIDVLDWLYDQGLVVGSGLGTNHHYGYDFRGVPKAIWLMQDVLKDAGKFQEAFDMIQYWTGVPEIRQLPETENFQGIVDAWNTIVAGRLMAIMLRDDSPELLRDMRSYTEWMNAVMQYSVGTMGGFKPDGSGFHHGMLYAGYMNGGYAGLGEVLNYVGNTPFNLSEEARGNFKKALFVHSSYANLRSIVNSVCGRKPMTQNLGTGSINAFAYLAKASDPIDTECAAEYMRLTKYKKELYNEFKALGIEAGNAPGGNISLNYGALNLHRRDNWLVAIKGFNKIVTGTEIYTSNNRYGRYQSYGTVQILGTGTTVDAAQSGFKLPGWDWNRFPGATTIHLPYDELNYSGGNLNERSKNSEFAGACSLNGNGVFGMYLDENDYTNYTDDFVARKSVFSFDNRVICLGSGISNSNTDYRTETTLFQTALASQSEKIIIDENEISQFPYSNDLEVNDPVNLMDAKGNGYYLPGGKIHVTRTNQESRDEKKKTVNYGDFATAWIDHGLAPQAAAYEYAILVQTNASELATFSQNMQGVDKPYEVIRKDNVAHIVSDRTSYTTAYVMFSADEAISSKHIKGVSYPCLVMAKDETDETVRLAFADPAINMNVPAGLTGADEAKERKVRVTLNGKYSLNESNEKCRLISSDNDFTVLEFTAIHGLVVEVSLSKAQTTDIDSDDLGYTIYVYPNPVENSLFIESVQPCTSLKVCNQAGQLVLSSAGHTDELDVAHLSNGLYFLDLNFGSGKNKVFKFIKK